MNKSPKTYPLASEAEADSNQSTSIASLNITNIPDGAPINIVFMAVLTKHIQDDLIEVQKKIDILQDILLEAAQETIQEELSISKNKRLLPEKHPKNYLIPSQ